MANSNDLTYQDYIQRINIQDALLHAGYRLNRRDGLRYPSYVRVDSNGQRVRGDKFIVTNQGKSCFRPPEQKTYNIISLIKTFPSMFPEYAGVKKTDHLVNEVCRKILNMPNEYQDQRIIEGHRDLKPYDINDYRIQRFDRKDFDTIKKFYPYFSSRGIDISTQKAFADHFVLASKEHDNGKVLTNLSFPLVIPGKDGIVGMEERGKTRLDGSSGYKGKAEGSNGSEGLWVAKLGTRPLEDAKHVYWFESAYDAMAYYQLHAKDNPNLRYAAFVSSGGNLTVGQVRGMLSVTQGAVHHLGFDNDRAGKEFVSTFEREYHQMIRSSLGSSASRKPYLDSLFGKTDITEGDARHLPKDLQEKYEAYKDSKEEYLAMQAGSLDPYGENAVKYARQRTEVLHDDFRKGVNRFLGLEEDFPDARYVREVPEKGKDWNDLLLLNLAEEEQDAKDRHEIRKDYGGVDLDGNGEIELNEMDETKRDTLKSRR